MVIQARGGDWAPKNIDGEFRGPVTVRRALEESLNVPAVRIAGTVGPRRVSDMARAVGIEHPVAAVPSVALGTSEVTLLEITRGLRDAGQPGRQGRADHDRPGQAERRRSRRCRRPRASCPPSRRS